MKSLIFCFILSPLMFFSFKSQAAKNSGNGENTTNIKVTTGRVINIKETQADCTYKVEGTATEKGVCYSDTPSPTINHKKVTAPANSGSTVTSALAGLKAGTKYYIRAYAKNGAEVVYGNELSFTTLAKGEDVKPKASPKVESKPESSKK